MTQADTDPWPDADAVRDPALENWLCFAIYSAEHAFTQFYRPLLEPLGLTYTQSLVMTLLWDRDARSVREIGEALHLKSSTLTPLIKRLEEAGLVIRRRDGDDERVVRVSLTDQGRALRDKAREVPEHVAEALEMSREELRETIDRLDHIRARLIAATR